MNGILASGKWPHHQMESTKYHDFTWLWSTLNGRGLFYMTFTLVASKWLWARHQWSPHHREWRQQQCHQPQRGYDDHQDLGVVTWRCCVESGLIVWLSVETHSPPGPPIIKHWFPYSLLVNVSHYRWLMLTHNHMNHVGLIMGLMMVAGPMVDCGGKEGFLFAENRRTKENNININDVS